jgi:hypothetical protein
MNNHLSALYFLLKNDSYRFDPYACRRANVSVMDAKLLRWLFFEEHSNTDVIKNFGRGIPYKLLKQGLVEKPLSDSDNSQTNIWKLSDDGLELLKTITGVRA